MPRRILVVDNYDSFVFTIVGYLEQLGAEVTVARTDEIQPAAGAAYDGVGIPAVIDSGRRPARATRTAYGPGE